MQGIATPHASARSTWCAPLGVWHVERMKINGAEVDTKSDASLNTSAVRIASLLRVTPPQATASSAWQRSSRLSITEVRGAAQLLVARLTGPDPTRHLADVGP